MDITLLLSLSAVAVTGSQQDILFSPVASLDKITGTQYNAVQYNTTTYCGLKNDHIIHSVSYWHRVNRYFTLLRIRVLHWIAYNVKNFPVKKTVKYWQQGCQYFTVIL